MKKVINPISPSDAIFLTDVLKKKFPLIGFQNNNGYKSTLVPVKFESNLYFARCLDGWNKGNGYNPEEIHEKTISQWEEFFRRCHKAEMFLFDSTKELFKWLAE